MSESTELEPIDLPAVIERFAYVALRTPPMPYRLLKIVEAYG